MFEMKMPKMDLMDSISSKMDPISSKMDQISSNFVPAFTYSVSEPTVTITNLPITDPRIPTLVESIGQQTANLDSNLRSPQQGHLDHQGGESNQDQPLYLNAHSPATGLSQLQINSPQALSPNPSTLSSSPQRTVSPLLAPNCPPSSPYIPTSPNLQRSQYSQCNQHNQQENQQALNEQNINDFIKSILAPDSPRLNDLGGNIFFDGSTLNSGTVCIDGGVSEPVSQEEKAKDPKEGDKSEERNFVTNKEEEEESKERQNEKENLTESFQKLDIA